MLSSNYYAARSLELARQGRPTLLRGRMPLFTDDQPLLMIDYHGSSEQLSSRDRNQIEHLRSRIAREQGITSFTTMFADFQHYKVLMYEEVQSSSL